MPESVSLTPVNDRSISIRHALEDVSLTLIGTIMLVVLVIFLFLRRFVATAIPALSLPVSLVGAVALLWGLNYSLDNISLLGLTLAVGLVVDDAIVVLENIIRHVEAGMPPFKAALRGAREVGFAIVAMTLTLAIRSRAATRRTTTLATSLPTVVGLAVWPWVRLSMGTSA